MKNLQLFLLLFFITFSCGKKKLKTNVYCRLPHCGIHNLACEANNTFSSICSPGIKLISLNPHEKHILQLLNNYRKKVALGYTKNLFPAARMARMSWSKELQNFAIMYITKCAFESRPCMSSPKFTNIGSTYDELKFSGVYKSSMIPMLVEDLMKGWFEDTRFVTRDMLLHLTPNFPRRSVRRTVLLMTDRNTHVGCSAVIFVSGSINHFNIVCTFATDNMNDLPIYKVSSNPGSQCKRRDQTYKDLCAFGENYQNIHQYEEGELVQFSDDTFRIY